MEWDYHTTASVSQLKRVQEVYFPLSSLPTKLRLLLALSWLNQLKLPFCLGNLLLY